MLGSLGMLLGLALVSIAANHSLGRLDERRLVDLIVLDNKGEGFGKVVCDGDRFVALDGRKDPKIGFLRNFDPGVDMLWVDDRYLGFDLCRKNKNVLVRELHGEVRGHDLQDIRWELVRHIVNRQGKEVLMKRFRVVNGELKGWWIGLGPLEKAKGDRLPHDRRQRAPLILVKDKEDAAGFLWEDPHDEGR
jgi:hypothetical protein